MAIFFRTLLVALLLATFAHGAETHFVPFTLEGETFIHDPSSIVRENGRYYIFATGPGIRAKSSPDLLHWTNTDFVFPSPPAWTKTVVPNFRGYFWAPDVVRVNGKYLLYYSVSSFGKKTSAIGVAGSPALNPAATNHLWTDLGPVIESGTNTPFNAIDPSAFLDDDGKLWLAFGSYWRGIYLAELNPQTGKRIATDSPLYKLAWNDSIEASCLAKHGKFYYLFVNWGECCKGTNSTYEVRVGRSAKITGPYLDREGYDLAGGGGTKFLQSNGHFIGPGHIGILTESNTTYFSYHYYDADTHGRSRLALGKIDWSSGWPMPVK